MNAEINLALTIESLFVPEAKFRTDTARLKSKIQGFLVRAVCGWSFYTHAKRILQNNFPCWTLMLCALDR